MLKGSLIKLTIKQENENLNTNFERLYGQVQNMLSSFKANFLHVTAGYILFYEHLISALRR